jgi:hypothetical protein
MVADSAPPRNPSRSMASWAWTPVQENQFSKACIAQDRRGGTIFARLPRSHHQLATLLACKTK